MTAQPAGEVRLTIPITPKFRELEPPQPGRCAWCRASLAESVSDDFCGDVCQGSWHRNNTGAFDGTYY